MNEQHWANFKSKISLIPPISIFDRKYDSMNLVWMVVCSFYIISKNRPINFPKSKMFLRLRNKCYAISTSQLQREHIKTTCIPLPIRLPYVVMTLCISFKFTNNIARSMLGCQINFVQERSRWFLVIKL